MDNNQFENDIPSDALDAMADMAEEQYQAMTESSQSEWTMLETNEQFVGFTVTNTQEWEGVIHDNDQGS